MMGLLKHHSGQVLYDAIPMSSRSRSLLRQIGFVPDGPENLIQDLTAEELWELQALAHSRVMGTVDEIMTRAVQLAEVLDFPPPRTAIRSYSHGMQKKTQLVAGLMHSPEYLLLDEPRNGLDPIAGERLDVLIGEECSRGRTIVVATHDLRYAERVAHSVVVLNRGKLTASGHPRYLRRENERNFVETFFRLVDEGS